MDLSTVKSRVRSLVDDADASYATDAFLLPLINQKYEELYNRMLSTGAEFECKVVELFNVPAQTANLSAYALIGQPLELMIQPLQFEWKQAGLDPTNYKTASLVDRLEDVIPGQLVDEWEWRAGVIYFTPSTLVLDLRIRGDFLFAALNADTDIVATTRNFGHALAYGTAALVGAVRGNQAWAQAYTLLQDNALDDIMQYLTRKDQGKIRRVGRMSRRFTPTPNTTQR
jgi:hypothetical protein